MPPPQCEVCANDEPLPKLPCAPLNDTPWDAAAAAGSAVLVAADAGAAKAIRGAAVMAAPAMTPAANFLMSNMISSPSSKAGLGA
jgi:hypothetical protein